MAALTSANARALPVLALFALFGLFGLALPSCALTPQSRERLAGDRALALTIHGARASPLHRRIFGGAGLDGAAYLAFIDARVREVSGEGIGFASCHGAFACSGAGDGTLRLSGAYGTADVPAIVRLSLLVHEARHAEGWPHELCPAGTAPSEFQRAPLEGVAACDRAALGAYGVQYVMLKNVARFCSTCSVDERRAAGEFADGLLGRIIDPRAREALTVDQATVGR